MTIASRGSLGTEKAQTGTGLSLRINGGASAVHDVVVVLIALDNQATADGVTSEVASVTDTGGNTYVKLAEYCNGQGAAGAGATVSLWYSVLTTALPNSTSFITVTHTGLDLNCCASAWGFSIDAKAVLQAYGATQNAVADGAAFPSMTHSGLPSREYLFIRASAAEGNIIQTASASFTNFSKINNTSQMCITGEWRILTGTSATSNPTNTGTVDNAHVMVALGEYLPQSMLFRASNF